MSRVAIVVHRCHESIVGGSEFLAWKYATLLKDRYEVDVLTTTALNISDWANVLPEGIEENQGVRINRFRVTQGRNPYWGRLYERLVRDYRSHFMRRRRGLGPSRYLLWNACMQEEFIKHQGPYSEPMMSYLNKHWADYDSLIFVTYLYPTTYFGLSQVPARRALFVPTLHDELPAYLSVFKQMAHRARGLIWLTDAERRVGERLWGELPGRVVAMDIESDLVEPAVREYPYLLYSGRIDPNKGCRELFDFFIRFKREHRSPLRLVLTGKDDIPIPRHPEIDFLGFVSHEEKLGLMAGARLFAMPSRNESFSIVTLEAMAQRTPVLVSAECSVLVEHIELSGGGRVYTDYESFAAAVNEIANDEASRDWMGRQGRDYVLSRYQTERVRAALIEAVESSGSGSV